MEMVKGSLRVQPIRCLEVAQNRIPASKVTRVCELFVPLVPSPRPSVTLLPLTHAKPPRTKKFWY
jgi:hypothetical protein